MEHTDIENMTKDELQVALLRKALVTCPEKRYITYDRQVFEHLKDLPNVGFDTWDVAERFGQPQLIGKFS